MSATNALQFIICIPMLYETFVAWNGLCFVEGSMPCSRKLLICMAAAGADAVALSAY